MKRKLLITAIAVLATLSTFAQLGAEITYRSIDSSKYEVTTIVYRDCRDLPLNNIGLYVTATGATGQNLTPTRVSIEEVKYECGSSASKCNPANTYATGFGMEKHTFKDTIDFGSAPFNTSGWTNACEVNIGYGACCRLNSSALSNAGNFYINATFNKCKALINSSPIFTNQPLFRVPGVQKTVYSYGMIDTADRDSLSIKLIAAKTGQTGTVTYASSSNVCSKPYSPDMPLSAYLINPCGPYKQTTTEGFYLDSYTGELYFTPVVTKEDGPIVVEVTEWRKNNSGVYEAVGTVMRESLVIVEDMPTNNAPTLGGPFIYQVNAGDQIQFDISSADQVVIPPPPNVPPPPDTLVVTWDSAIDGATFNIVDPNARAKKGRFTWTPTCDDVIDDYHRFTVTVRDNNCSYAEVRSSRTVLVKVNRIKEIDLGTDITICDGDSVTLEPKNGFTGQFVWDNSDTTYSRTVSAAGTYTLRGINFCNDTAYDTITVSIAAKPTVDLGVDTNLCENIDYFLHVTAPNATKINWSTGEITDTISADTTRPYWVTVSDMYCGVFRDTVNIVRHAIPDVNLGTDTFVCNSDTLELFINAPNANDIIWNGGIHNSMVEVSEANAGTWEVLVEDKYCGDLRDTIEIDHHNSPSVNLGADTSYCGSYSRVLDAGTGSLTQTYLWSRANEMTQTITVSNFGTYWVDVTNICGTTRDSINILDTTSLNFTLGPDRLICDKDSLEIGIPLLNAAYQWSTNANDTNETITIDSTGLYWVEITLCSQTKRDSIYLTFDKSPDVNLGADTSFNGTVSDTLDAGNAGSTYLWSTSDTTQTIIVNSTGTYWVTATNQCGSDTDSITISLVGINKLDVLSDDVSLYPNPSTGLFTINFSSIKVSNFTMVVTSVDGKQIMSRDVNAAKGSNHTEYLDLSNLQAGVYYVILKTNSGNSTLKLLLSK